MIREHPDIPAIIDYTDEDDASKTECTKDTGTRKKLQKWTRGHLFIVRDGGPLTLGSPSTSKHLIMLTCQISTCVLPFIPI